MKRIFFLFLILIGIELYSEPYYKSYCNSRFQFCMDYPKFFIANGESQNGDGQIFLSPDKQAEIRMEKYFIEKPFGNLLITIRKGPRILPFFKH